MQPPILPIKHSDLQWAAYTDSTAQPVATTSVSPPVTTKPSPTFLMNSIIVLLFLTALGTIVYKKRREDSLHQQIRKLERLWQTESHSPFEEHQ